MGKTLMPPLELILAWQTDRDAYPRGIRRDWSLVIWASVLSALAVIMVFTRLIARLRFQRNPGSDDAFITPALLFTVAMNVLIAYASRHGFDRHIWDMTPAMGVDLRKFTFTTSLLYIWGTGLTKISVLLFYRRLTASLPTPFLYAVYASLLYVTGYILAFTASLVLTCAPVAAYWLEVDFAWAAAHATSYRCTDEGAALIAANAISVTQDFLACVLPALLFWNLQVSRRQKLAMAALLGVSIFPCVAGILRFVALHRATYTTYDIPWAMHPTWIWTLVEANTGLVCASVPALRVFFKRALASGSNAKEDDDEERTTGVRTIGSKSTAGGMREVGGGGGYGGMVELELKGMGEGVAGWRGGGGSATPTESMRSEEDRELDERRLVWWGWRGQEL